MKFTVVLCALLGLSLLAVARADDAAPADTDDAALLEVAQKAAAESVVDQDEIDGPPAPQLFDINNQGAPFIHASMMDPVNPANNLKYIQQFDNIGLEDLQAQELEYYRQRWEPSILSREPVSFIEEHETDPTITMHYTMPVAEESVHEHEVDNIMSSDNDAQHTVSEHTPAPEHNSFLDLQDRVTHELLQDAGDNSHLQLGLDDDFSDVDAKALSALDDDQSLDVLLDASSDNEDVPASFLEVSEDGEDMMDSVDEEDASTSDDLDLAVGEVDDFDAEDTDAGLAEAEADTDLNEENDDNAEQPAAEAPETPAQADSNADLDQIESDVNA